MTILEDLKNRKILNNITSQEKFDKLPKGVGVYIGFDPTSSSLHLGNYIQISILKKFAKFGFRPIAILGGATGMIGDPSGKSKERTFLGSKELAANKKAIKSQLEKYGLTVIDNYDFYKNMNVLTFLREVGKLLNVNYMINKDVVQSRLDTGISFTEFSYQLIQGWDFKKLYEDNDVRIQVGGSDQWGNITSGIEIIRKTQGDKNLALGITTELLTTSSGKKFGKSEKGALFIDSSITSPFEIYQFLLNSTDDDVEKFLLWITELEVKEINELMVEHNMEPFKRIAQKKLAEQVVKDIHSKEEADNVIKLSNVLFGKGDITKLKTSQIAQLENVIPTINSKGGNILELLVELKVATSKRQAREFIESNSISINGIIINNNEFIITPKEFGKKYSLIKRGKKKFYLIKH